MNNKDNYYFDELCGWIKNPISDTARRTGETTLSKERDPFRVGDLVEHAGGRARISECCGKNSLGLYEYYIEYCIPTAKPDYVTEREIVFISGPGLPPLPDSKKTSCLHAKAYKNSMPFSGDVFWVCPDCKVEVEKPGKFSKAEQECLDEFRRMLR